MIKRIDKHIRNVIFQNINIKVWWRVYNKVHSKICFKTTTDVYRTIWFKTSNKIKAIKSGIKNEKSRN